MSNLVRRVSTLLCLTLLLVSSGWARPPRIKRTSDSAVAMLSQAPLESALAIGWNTRDEFDVGQTLSRIKKEQVGPARALVSIDETIGVPLDSLLACLNGSGYFSLSVRPRSAPRFCVAFRLDDQTAVRTWLNRSWAPSRFNTTKSGRAAAFWSYDDATHASISEGWLTFCNDRYFLHRLAAERHRTLEQDPLLREALTRVPSQSGAIVSFAHGYRMRELWYRTTPLAWAFPDDEMAFWDYAVGSVDMKKRQTDGFLLVPENGTELRRALVRPPGFDSGVLAHAPSTSLLAGFQVGWLCDVVVALGHQSPTMAGYLGELFGDSDAYVQFGKAFPGSAAFATDFLEGLVALETRPAGIAIAARVDDAVAADRIISSTIKAYTPDPVDACASNLRNIGTAMEIWSTDNSGKYPTSISALVPDYLREIPVCPVAGVDTYSASLQTGPKAEGNDAHYQDYYLVKCSGHHHSSLQVDHPQYNGLVGLTMGQLPDPPAAEVSAPLPSATSDRRYEIGDVLVNLEGSRGLMRLASGSKASDWVSGKAEQKLPARVQEAAKWAGNDLLGLLYLDYTLGRSAASSFLETQANDEALLMAALLDAFVGTDDSLDDIHLLRTVPDGLAYRGQGFSSSRALGTTGVLTAAILYPNFLQARSQGRLTACKSNLKNIATAMEMWSTDNSGRYPTSLEQLVPDYLRTIPVCPEAGRDTYSASLQTGREAEGNEKTRFQDYYLIKCLGHNHPSLEGDYPQYNGIQGLIDDASERD